MKEAKAQKIDSSLPSLSNSSFLSLFIFDKDGTKVYTSQKESLVTIPQVQFEAQKVVKEDDKFEELKVTTALEEQLAIQTLVTLPISITPIKSQTLQRLSIDATPLQILRCMSSTSKSADDTGDVSLDEVVELPKYKGKRSKKY